MNHPFPTAPAWPTAALAASPPAVNQTTGEVYMRADGVTPMTQEELRNEWAKADVLLKTLKGKEAKLRKMLVGVFGTDMQEGSESIDLPDGATLKIEHKLNYKVKSKRPDMDDVSAINDVIARISTAGGDGLHVILASLLKWSADVRVGAYRELQKQFPQHAAIFDEVLETSDGMPTIEIKQPKGTQ